MVGPMQLLQPLQGRVDARQRAKLGPLACVLKAYALRTKNKRRFKVHFLPVSTRIIKESGFLPGQKESSAESLGLVGANYYR